MTSQFPVCLVRSYHTENYAHHDVCIHALTSNCDTERQHSRLEIPTDWP